MYRICGRLPLRWETFCLNGWSTFHPGCRLDEGIPSAGVHKTDFGPLHHCWRRDGADNNKPRKLELPIDIQCKLFNCLFFNSPIWMCSVWFSKHRHGINNFWKSGKIVKLRYRYQNSDVQIVNYPFINRYIYTTLI